MRNHRDGEYLITYQPIKALLIFALPILIGNIFQQIYQMVDSIVVGRLVSQNALAAIGASAALTNIFICLAVGAGLGASVLTGRYFGARNYKKMKEIISTAMICFLIFSIFLGLLGLFFSKELLILLNTPDQVLGMAAVYLKVYFAGFPFLFMYNVFSSTFNAMGKSEVPLAMLIFSSILNVILDLVMVGPMQMGVFGAALATLIAQGISAVLSFIILVHDLKGYESGSFSYFSGGEAKEMLALAVPSMIQQSTVAIGMLLVQSVVNSFGAEALAGYSAAVRVENIAFVPLTSMASAFSSYVAQNLGAGQKKRIIKGFQAGFAVDIVFALLILFVMEVFPGRLIDLFLGEGGTALARQTAIGYMSFLGFFFLILGLKTLADSVLRGMGFVKVFLIANLVNLGIRVLAAFTLAPHFGIQVIWQVVPIGWTVGFLISFTGYLKKKKELQLDRE
jgi:putative MATE family efflux protein